MPTHLAYQVVGSGTTDVMSIPGYPFAPPLDAWQEQPQLARAVEDLSSFARLILWDPRGTGLSDRFARAHPIEDEIADAVAVLDAVESDRAVLLGWAWSGLPAMLLAAMRPDRTAGLVLFGNSFATTFRAPDYPWGQTREEWKADVQGIVDRWGSAVELDWLAPSVAENEPFRAWWGTMAMRFAATRGTSRRTSRCSRRSTLGPRFR